MAVGLMACEFTFVTGRGDQPLCDSTLLTVSLLRLFISSRYNVEDNEGESRKVCHGPESNSKTTEPPGFLTGFGGKEVSNRSMCHHLLS